jgi:hypothetical protein
MNSIRCFRFSRVAAAVWFAASIAAVSASSALAHPSANKPLRQPVVQLALLLDTSNSMDGLIDQARSRLWQVVNDLAKARCEGARPRLVVALLEYGNNSLTSSSHYIRVVSEFTDDLDLLSDRLFALRTNGGSEYCGAVIDRAIECLAWSNRDHDLKLLFIAGNEPFDQGPIDFRHAVHAARRAGVTVNTIFCGPWNEGACTHWQDGATLANGTYASIDQDKRVPHIDCPQDREIARLNISLNATYLAYGSEGKRRAEMQTRQDANAAAAAPGVAAERAQAKSSALYDNRTWDLVDAVNESYVETDKLAAADLPEELRGLSAKERDAKIAQLAAERKRIQAEIQKLAAEREAYVAAETAKFAAASGDASSALDDAILKSVRAQAAKLNYEFEK